MIFRCNNRGIRAVSALMCGAMLWGSVPAAMAADTEEIAIEIEDTDAESGWNLLDAMADAVQPELTYAAVENGYYRFVNAASGDVWTTKGRGGADGAKIVCRTDEEMTTQVYQLKQAQDGTFRLLSCTVKGLVLRVSGSGLVQTAQTGADSERFCAVQEENGTLSIRSVSNPDLALTQSGSSVVLEQYNGGSGQQWTLKQMDSIHQKTISSGVYTIDNAKYNKSIKVSGSSLTMDDKTISDSQKFQIKYVGDGKYTIRAYSGTGKRVNTSSSAGSAVKLSSSGCRYYIDRKADGTYAIIRAGTRDTAVKAGSTSVTTTRYDGGTSQSWTFDSKVVEDEAAVSKTLSKIQTRYPSGSWLGSGYSFAGGYQCMGFGREVFYRTFGTETHWSYDGSPKSSVDTSKYTVAARSSSYSASSMKKLIAKASPGDVLQMDAPKVHTMIFLGSDSNGFTVYDANWTGANQVSVRYVSYGAWSGRNSSGICVLHSTNYPAK